MRITTVGGDDIEWLDEPDSEAGRKDRARENALVRQKIRDIGVTTDVQEIEGLIEVIGNAIDNIAGQMARFEVKSRFTEPDEEDFDWVKRVTTASSMFKRALDSADQRLALLRKAACKADANALVQAKALELAKVREQEKTARHLFLKDKDARKASTALRLIRQRGLIPSDVLDALSDEAKSLVDQKMEAGNGQRDAKERNPS